MHNVRPPFDCLIINRLRRSLGQTLDNGITDITAIFAAVASVDTIRGQWCVSFYSERLRRLFRYAMYAVLGREMLCTYLHTPEYIACREIFGKKAGT